MRRIPFVIALLVGLFLLFWSVQSRRNAAGLVVYCSHDRVYSQPILDRFTEQTGIPISVVGDTEASKSLGLVRRLQAERDSPQCDLLWSNELLGTMQLAEDGLLLPHAGDEWVRRPDRFRDPEGRWTGLGGRFRIQIANPDATKGIAIADPMFGTSLTHAAVMWDRRGGDWYRDWFEQMSDRDDVLIVPGNGPACELVVRGKAGRGWTDVDDWIALAGPGGGLQTSTELNLDDPFGRPTDDPVTILIPNTVAVVAGTDRPDAARQLADYLLSEPIERELWATAMQIPLGQLTEPPPEGLDRWLLARDRAIDLRGLLGARREVLGYLTARAAGQHQ